MTFPTYTVRPFGKPMSDNERKILAMKLVLAQLDTVEWQQALAADMHKVEHGESLSMVGSTAPEDCGRCHATAAQALKQIITFARP